VADVPETDDPLAALRAHVRSAQDAAERLAREATRTPDATRTREAGAAQTGQAAEATRPSSIPDGADDESTPESGWAAAGREGQGDADVRALVGLVESLRRLLPEELRTQLNELIRQILLLLRALIDWLVARIERDGSGHEVEIEDIPIS
jgi:hypothetical protein